MSEFLLHVLLVVVAVGVCVTFVASVAAIVWCVREDYKKFRRK